MSRKKLSRGFGAIKKENYLNLGKIEAEVGNASKSGTSFISVDLVDPNPKQPRKTFSDEGIEALKTTIEKQGLIQPIIVRKHGSRYQVIAGERRLRAHKSLGKREVETIIREVDDVNLLSLALLENIQREDLNAIDKGEAIRDLLVETGSSQDQLAVQLGMKRPTLANFVRLLDLDLAVQALVKENRISMGHARAILAVPREKQAELGKKVVEESLSVRQIESLVSKKIKPAKVLKKYRGSEKNAHLKDIEDILRKHYGTKIDIRENEGKGSFQIHFYDLEDFNRIYGILSSEL